MSTSGTPQKAWFADLEEASRTQSWAVGLRCVGRSGKLRNRNSRSLRHQADESVGRENDDLRDGKSCVRGTILVQWDNEHVGVIGTFVIVESDIFIFIRFNLRRHV